MFTTIGCKDSFISDSSNDSTKEACKAAPRATNSDGFKAFESKDGAIMLVVSGNKKEMLLANLGVWAAPPTNNTSSISNGSKSALAMTFRQKQSFCLMGL